MIVQIKNKSVRDEVDLYPDKLFLNNHFEQYGYFPLFKQVLIETRTDCNNHCPFCPHAFNDKAQGVMEWGTYCRIIDQLCDANYNGRVALMLSNEPLLDKRLVDMIKYAKSKSQRLFLDITTNGRLLTLEMTDLLFSVGLDNININDYRDDREQNINKLSGSLIDIHRAYSNNPKITFHYRSLNEQLPNYGGNIPQPINDENMGFCNFPFRKLTISYKGDILICCNDFMYVSNFGNVHTHSIIDCWNSKEYNKIRFALLSDTRIDLCRKCNDSQNYNAFSL